MTLPLNYNNAVINKMIPTKTKFISAKLEKLISTYSRPRLKKVIKWWCRYMAALRHVMRGWHFKSLPMFRITILHKFILVKVEVGLNMIQCIDDAWYWNTLPMNWNILCFTQLLVLMICNREEQHKATGMLPYKRRKGLYNFIRIICRCLL
jgi:hypothetical protein